MFETPQESIRTLSKSDETLKNIRSQIYPRQKFESKNFF
jgi:hypothetical protein